MGAPTISRRSLLIFLIPGLAALLLIAAACGGGDDDDTGGDDGGAVSFDVTLTDNKFDPAEFTVPPGSSVTFNLTNNGAAMHNMRIAGEDGKYNSDDDAVSDPDLVNGGATATVEWTAPGSPGETKFQCDFHPTDGQGTITIE
jgi:plastocyanin